MKKFITPTPTIYNWESIEIPEELNNTVEPQKTGLYTIDDLRDAYNTGYNNGVYDGGDGGDNDGGENANFNKYFRNKYI